MTKPVATSVFLLVLAALSTALVVLTVAPFAGALFAGAVMAGVMHPAQQWLAARLGGRTSIAAGILTTGVVVVVLAPLALLGVYGTDQLSRGIDSVVETMDEHGVEGLVAKLPQPLRATARDVIERIPQSVLPRHDLEASSEAPSTEAAKSSAARLDLGAVAGWVATSVQTATGLVIDLGVLVLALFFLLSQGARLVEWVISVVPLPDTQAVEMLERFRDVTRAVFVATLGSAMVQTLIAAVGFLIAGVAYLPVALLFTFVAALVPVVGGAVVVASVGAITWFSGEMGFGLFLVLWGIGPVGLSDNLVKPMLTERSLRLPAAMVFLAMLGGVSVFGPMGVVAGPLVFTFFTATLRLMRQEGWIQS